MTTETMRTRIATGCATIFLSFGTLSADTGPATEGPVAPPVRSEVQSAATPLPLVSSDDIAPWSSERFVAFSSSGMCPLKPADEMQPTKSATNAQAAVPEVAVPATVQNVRRVDSR